VQINKLGEKPVHEPALLADILAICVVSVAPVVIALAFMQYLTGFSVPLL